MTRGCNESGVGLRRAVRIEDGLLIAQVGQLDDQIQLGQKHGGATGVKRNSNNMLMLGHPLGGIPGFLMNYRYELSGHGNPL